MDAAAVYSLFNELLCELRKLQQSVAKLVDDQPGPVALDAKIVRQQVAFHLFTQYPKAALIKVGGICFALVACHSYTSRNLLCRKRK
jgi:hypothetical protein